MSRDCRSCKANGDEGFYRCGFIPEDKRTGSPILVPATGTADFTLDVCPVYSYLQYSYLYKLYNIMRDSNVNLMELPFQKRILYTTFTEYLNQKKLYELKKQEEMNGN